MIESQPMTSPDADGPVPRFAVGELLDYADFAATAREAPGRCILLARHGERPAIDPGDPTFGRNLPLTEAGVALARQCGRALRPCGPLRDWTFGASALRRTIMTAECVATELGADPPNVPVCPEVGIPGLWIEDAAAVYRAQRRDGVRTYHDRQMKTGVAEGFWSCAQCVRNVLRWVAGPSIRTRLAFYSTHDCHLGCLLTGTGAARIDADHWVGFLQGCALMEQSDGSWRVHYIVPDKANYDNTFIF